MKKQAAKLYIAGAALVLALVLLASATFAWFTISTNPEIKSMEVSLYSKQTLLLSSDNLTYSQNIDLSSLFKDFAPLHPVSTLDGINWFIPTYNNNGVINDPSDFILDDTLAYANVLTVTTGGTPLTGTDLTNAENRGYYVYADFWMQTEEESVDVRLSVPSLTSNLDTWEIDQGTYGSYVLPGFVSTATDGGTTVTVDDNKCQNSMRIGFLIDSNKDGKFTSADPFYIYEPNADARSSVQKPGSDFYDETYFVDEDDEVYVSGFTYDQATYASASGKYYLTLPIVKDSETGKGRVATVSEIDTSRLLIQKQSAWKTGTAFTNSFTTYNKITSNAVATFGRFLDPADYYTATGEYTPAYNTPVDVSSISGTIGSGAIVRLTSYSPVKVRMFVWIEGQDVDCWNDIAGGSFYINLELAGANVQATS